MYERNLLTWISFTVIAPELWVIKTAFHRSPEAHSTISIFNNLLTEIIAWHYLKIALVLGKKINFNMSAGQIWISRMKALSFSGV